MSFGPQFSHSRCYDHHSNLALSGELPPVAGQQARAPMPPVDLNREICDKFGVSTRELIEKELSTLPESLQREVFDFAHFLHLKNSDDSFNGLLLSETALARDWNTPEEDAAWASL